MKAYLTFFLIFVSVCAKASSEEVFKEIVLGDETIPPSVAVYYLDSHKKHGLHLERIFENYDHYDKNKHHFIILSVVLYFKYYEQLNSKKYALYKQVIQEEMNHLESEILRSLDIDRSQLLLASQSEETKKMLRRKHLFKEECFLKKLFCSRPR